MYQKIFVECRARLRWILPLAWGAAISLAAHPSHASTIYSDALNHPSANLNGQAPSIPNTPPNWSASLAWAGNGSITGSNIGGGDNAFLPFPPANGNIYELTATFSLSSTSSSWFALGFVDSSNISTPFYNDTSSSPWMLLTGQGNYYTSKNGTGNLVGPIFFGTVATFKVELNTMAPVWTASFFVNNTLVSGPLSYTTNPTTISGVGFGRADDAIGSVSNFSLTVVPEPASWTLALMAGLAWLASARRKCGEQR